jgi:hypothetical protein
VLIKKLIDNKYDIETGLKAITKRAYDRVAEVRNQLATNRRGLEDAEIRIDVGWGKPGKYAKKGDLVAHLEAVGTHRRTIEQLKKKAADADTALRKAHADAVEDVKSLKGWADDFRRRGKPADADAALREAADIEAKYNARLAAHNDEQVRLLRAVDAEREAIDGLEAARAKALRVTGGAADDIKAGAARMNEANLRRVDELNELAEKLEHNAAWTLLKGENREALKAEAAQARATAAEILGKLENRPAVERAAMKIAMAGADSEAALARNLERAKQGFMRPGAAKAAAAKAAAEAEELKNLKLNATYHADTEVVLRDGKYVYAHPERAAKFGKLDPTKQSNFEELAKDIARYGPATNAQERFDRVARVAAAQSSAAQSSGTVASAAKKQVPGTGGVKSGLAKSLKDLAGYRSLFKI